MSLFFKGEGGYRLHIAKQDKPQTCTGMTINLCVRPVVLLVTSLGQAVMPLVLAVTLLVLSVRPVMLLRQ